VARTAVRGRLGAPLHWQPARLLETRDESESARTLVLQVADWDGHLPGQHVDVRLTAPDGYSTERSYSLAAPPAEDRIELTVQLVPDGEVSPFLVQDYAVGEVIEVRGPVGGWFVWLPEQTDPLLLVAGGSGVVPLMSIVRAHREVSSRAPLHLVYSVRTIDDAYYRDELRAQPEDGDGPDLTFAFTRKAPDGWPRQPGRLTADDLRLLAPPLPRQQTFVCGPTGFVEAVTTALVSLGHDPARIRTERFGPTGG
jgi:ferredoxin-NADP reductase